jgi:hypothetical protein
MRIAISKASCNSTKLVARLMPDSLCLLLLSESAFVCVQNLPFQQVAHQVTSLDSQPTSGDGVMVFVCGNLKVRVLCFRYSTS